jgi:hypothetical protein
MNYGRAAFTIVASGLLASLLTTPALAQETNTQAQAEAQGQVGMGLPGATAGGTATTTAGARPAPGNSDHDMMVGHIGIGYLGRRSLQIGALEAGGSVQSVPVIGARIWLNQAFGLDLGLGLLIQGASADDEAGDDDGPDYFATILHGGVPLALASNGHFTFEVVPEANIGFGSGSAGDADFSGFAIDLGARAGSEIHFGFIGIPQLSLQASVGVLFSMARGKTEVGDAERTEKITRLQTATYDNPWNIFTSNVAPLYYF